MEPAQDVDDQVHIAFVVEHTDRPSAATFTIVSRFDAGPQQQAKTAGAEPRTQPRETQTDLAPCHPRDFLWPRRLGGMSAADSLGMYLTYAPRPGRLDSERNCISNIHAHGLSIDRAAALAEVYATAASQQFLTGPTLQVDAELPGLSQR